MISKAKWVRMGKNQLHENPFLTICVHIVHILQFRYGVWLADESFFSASHTQSELKANNKKVKHFYA